MRFSIWPIPIQQWSDLIETVRHAEATGWDGVYVADHFMGDAGRWGPAETPMLEATAVLSGLASATQRLRLGSLVFGITYRHPAVLANWAVTTDQASDGRLLLGVGAGWQENEHQQYGIPLGSPRERLERLDEACQVLLGLLRTPRTNVLGRHYQVRDAVCEPKPLQDPLPLLIGGSGDRMLGLVARYADEWNMWALPETIRQRRSVLDQRCEKLDRDPASIATSCQALWFLTDDAAKADELVRRVSPRPAIGGPADRLVESVAAWRDAGVDEVIVPSSTLGEGAQLLDRMDAIMTEVASKLR
jgi:F420-dependent oxidoreductase-like protein